MIKFTIFAFLDSLKSIYPLAKRLRLQANPQVKQLKRAVSGKYDYLQLALRMLSSMGMSQSSDMMPHSSLFSTFKFYIL